MNDKLDYIWELKDIEDYILNLCQGLLCINDINIDDNFFNIGGDSLSSIIFITRVFKEFNVELPLVVFLSNGTLRGISTYIFKNLKGNIV